MTSASIYSDQKYVVYHTTYSGDKLPANYIGSTSIDKIQQGYKGSVKSKEYKSIWESELNVNPHLFSIEIISYHDTRPAATYKELQIQKLFNVVTNPLFINKSYAQPNGFFGMKNHGKNNSRFGVKGKPAWNKGKTTSEEIKLKISIAKKGKTSWNKGISVTEEIKLKMSIAKKGKTPWNKGKTGAQQAWNKGIKQIQPIITCPHCNKTGGTSNMKRYHFDNCKFK